MRVSTDCAPANDDAASKTNAALPVSKTCFMVYLPKTVCSAACSSTCGHKLWNLVGAAEQFLPRAVHPQNHEERAGGRRQPIAFAVRTRAFVLDVNLQRAVVALLEPLARRVDQVAVERIIDEEPLRQVVHGH